MSGLTKYPAFGRFLQSFRRDLRFEDVGLGKFVEILNRALKPGPCGASVRLAFCAAVHLLGAPSLHAGPVGRRGCVYAALSSEAQGVLRRPTNSGLWRVLAESELKGRPILLVSDIHGHREKLETLLKHAKIVDSRGNWAKGCPAIVVEVGDLINKGPDSFGVVELSDRLAREAEASSGELIQVVGNHEIEYLQNPEKATRELIESIESAGRDPDRVLTERSRFTQSLRRAHLGAILGETGFLHSGRIGQKSLAKTERALLKRDYDAEALVSEKKSPIFARDWEWDEDDLEKTVKNSLALGLKTLVVGHQPQGFDKHGVVHWRWKDVDFHILKIDSGMPEDGGSAVYCPDAARLSREGPSACVEILLSGKRRPIRPRD